MARVGGRCPGTTAIPSPISSLGVDLPRQRMFYLFETRKGRIGIVPRGDRWHVIYNAQDLGSYPSAQLAARSAAGGHGLFPSNGVDLATLGIPGDLNRWSID